MNIKFSFFLPVYNEEKRIGACIKSIVNQDYPQDKIEILVVDGGSKDNTKAIASQYPCVKIFDNPKMLADYGTKIAIENATGDIFVIFAADNELVGRDWLLVVSKIFEKDNKISAMWGRIVSGENDPSLNKYYQLIQNDPLSFFINKNLSYYLTHPLNNFKVNGKKFSVFEVDPKKPLIWGANGLVYRTTLIKRILCQDVFIGDNDVFQIMLEEGNNVVAYSPDLNIIHHHVSKLKDWIKKWKRNFIQHLVSQSGTRNMNWIFTDDFKPKLFFWILYNALPFLPLFHCVYLFIRDKKIHWLYHPIVNFAQFFTYVFLVTFSKDGHNFIRSTFLGMLKVSESGGVYRWVISVKIWTAFLIVTGFLKHFLIGF